MQFIWLVCIFIATLSRSALTFGNPQGIAVGFDLKYSYGTAAISYPNGTVKEIARVQQQRLLSRHVAQALPVVFRPLRVHLPRTSRYLAL